MILGLGQTGHQFAHDLFRHLGRDSFYLGVNLGLQFRMLGEHFGGGMRFPFSQRLRQMTQLC